jgi:hypothetical protein
VLVATRVVPNSDDGKAIPAVAAEIVRTNSRRDMAESSAVASRVSDWAAVEAAWRRSLARGVCAIMKLVCSTAIVLFCAKDFNAAFHIRGCILRSANPEPDLETCVAVRRSRSSQKQML